MLEMLTGSELEQRGHAAVTHCSASVVPSAISVFPVGPYCTMLMHGGHTCTQSCNSPGVTLRRRMCSIGILRKLKATATAPAKAEERRMILTSPVGDQA